MGGQVPRRPDQQQGGAPGAQVAPGSTNVVRAKLVIVSGTGAGTGLFVYNGTPGTGNPPIFWATSASADPFGNTLPSTSGVAGTGTFEAGDTIINASGIFTYSSAPAAGNLVASEAPAANSDQFDNNYLAGLASYTAGAAMSVAAGIISFYSGSLAGGWTLRATQQFFGGLILLSTGLETQNNVLDDGTGNCSVLGTMTVQGTSLSVGNGSTANLFLSPKMAAPPNAAAVAAGTATLAQLNAFCNGLYSSMRNRGMFN
jgi:hypothetical protein